MVLPDHIPLAVTMGDPAGIGPEICAALAGITPPAVVIPILVADGTVLRQAASAGLPELAPISPETDPSSLKPGSVYIYDLHSERKELRACGPSAEGGRASVRFLEGALELIEAGLVSGVVTAPISKESWKLAGFKHPGHTEFFREAADVERTEMLFVAGDLRVALFTTHIPLLEAAAAVRRESVADFIRFVVWELDRYGMRRLRVALAGLNPHA